MKRLLLLAAVAGGAAVWWRRRSAGSGASADAWSAAEASPAAYEPPKLGGDVDPELLAILACPLDKHAVTREGNYLVCGECQRHYPDSRRDPGDADRRGAHARASGGCSRVGGFFVSEGQRGCAPLKSPPRGAGLWTGTPVRGNASRGVRLRLDGFGFGRTLLLLALEDNALEAFGVRDTEPAARGGGFCPLRHLAAQPA